MWELLKPIIGPTVSNVVGLIPDPNARAKAQEDLEKTIVDGLAQVNAAQADINKIEAAHKSLFVAGWRPFIGWTCGIGLFWNFIGHPFAQSILLSVGSEVVLPPLVSDNLMELTLGMLGMAGLRSFEKMKGIARPR